eukprot:Rmarinus@m.17565
MSLKTLGQRLSFHDELLVRGRAISRISLFFKNPDLEREFSVVVAAKYSKNLHRFLFAMTIICFLSVILPDMSIGGPTVRRVRHFLEIALGSFFFGVGLYVRSGRLLRNELGYVYQSISGGCLAIMLCGAGARIILLYLDRKKSDIFIAELAGAFVIIYNLFYAYCRPYFVALLTCGIVATAFYPISYLALSSKSDLEDFEVLTYLAFLMAIVACVYSARANELLVRQVFLQTFELKNDRTRLQRINATLAKHLENSDAANQLNTPVVKAVDTIDGILSSDDCTDDEKKSLRLIKEALGQAWDELYRPQFSTEEEEIREWLSVTFEIKKPKHSVSKRRRASQLRLDIHGRNRISGTGSKGKPSTTKVFPLDDVLSQIETDIAFDPFSFAALTDNKPLHTMAMYIFDQTGLLGELGLDRKVMSEFVTRVENGYQRSNPYHNNIHACEVLRMTYYLVQDTALLSESLTTLELFAALFAAIIHDVHHPGVNNDFLVKKELPLSVIYNDRAVLENFHLCSAFVLMQTQPLDLFRPLSREERLRLRSLIIRLVLGTDMASHYELTTRLQTLAASSIDVSDSEMRAFLLSVALKCADLGHCAAPPEYHRKWSVRVMAEFFYQGDQERLLGMPVSSLMDREKTNAQSAQIGFFEYLVLPLFEAYIKATGGGKDLLTNARKNLERWRSNAFPAIIEEVGREFPVESRVSARTRLPTELDRCSKLLDADDYNAGGIAQNMMTYLQEYSFVPDLSPAIATPDEMASSRGSPRISDSPQLTPSSPFQEPPESPDVRLISISENSTPSPLLGVKGRTVRSQRIDTTLSHHARNTSILSSASGATPASYGLGATSTACNSSGERGRSSGRSSLTPTLGRGTDSLPDISPVMEWDDEADETNQKEESLRMNSQSPSGVLDEAESLALEKMITTAIQQNANESIKARNEVMKTESSLTVTAGGRDSITISVDPAMKTRSSSRASSTSTSISEKSDEDMLSSMLHMTHSVSNPVSSRLSTLENTPDSDVRISARDIPVDGMLIRKPSDGPTNPGSDLDPDSAASSPPPPMLGSIPGMVPSTHDRKGSR